MLSFVASALKHGLGPDLRQTAGVAFAVVFGGIGLIGAAIVILRKRADQGRRLEGP